ncbi:MAG: radical SAM protein, partial [Dehalococcoidia bacterium]|nr:radical SAM protein [Dehalococcoidia bacterium]
KYMTDALFEKLAAARFRYLCTGAESAHPEVLRLVGKGATVEDNTAFVRLCVRHGIKPKVFTMVGLPGESPESVEALARWLEQMAADGLSDADTTICTPTSGTPLFEQADKWLASGLISFDKAELQSNDEAVNYKGIPGQYKSYVSTPTLSREEIVRSRDLVERRFRKAARLPALVGGKDDG